MIEQRKKGSHGNKTFFQGSGAAKFPNLSKEPNDYPRKDLHIFGRKVLATDCSLLGQDSLRRHIL